MHRNRLLFLDTEFTGLDKDQDHLVQVAWVMTDLEGNILTNKRLLILKRNGKSSLGPSTLNLINAL